MHVWLILPTIVTGSDGARLREALDSRSHLNPFTGVVIMHAIIPSIEPLESRIAPAIIIAANALSAKWTDVDGDLVTLNVNKPVLDLGNFQYGPRGLGDEVNKISVIVAGLDITITAKPQDVNADGLKEGDGLVNIGWISASGVNLGKVSIAGDLAEIDAGDNLGTALKSLTVRSLGERGFDTGGADLESTLAGRLGALVVKGNVRDAEVRTTGPFGSIGSVFIGGSLIGGATQQQGGIFSDGVLGPVKIVGDVVGGSAEFSGGLASNGRMVSVTIGGSLIGGTALRTGTIESQGEMGPVKIAGDVRGGSGLSSGIILGREAVTSVTIGGSLVGGSGDSSGRLTAEGKFGPLKICRDVVGSVDAGTGSIFGFESLSSVTIGGSMFGGRIGGSSTVGAVSVKGSIIGTAADPVSIDAVGTLTSSSKPDIALKSLKVGGRVEWANLLFGISENKGINGDVQIGPIAVGGDWITSNLAVGIDPTNGSFGDASDKAVVPGVPFFGAFTRNDPTVLSKIASVAIGGGVYGVNGTPGLTHFGFVAEQIGSFKVNGVNLPLKSGAKNDTFALNAARAVGASLSTVDVDGFAVHVIEV